MGAQRTSMKDVLAAIEAQNATLNALVSAIAGQAQAPTPTVVTEPAPVVKAEPAQEADNYKVPAAYMERMESKVEDAVATDGLPRVIYLRRNLKGETKIAYCLKSRWPTLRDNGLLGAVKVID